LELKKKKLHLHSQPKGITQKQNGAVAQSVEQRTENPCVAGSIPAHTTSKAPEKSGAFFVSPTFIVINRIKAK
jgi:hypothetical protein